MGTFCVPSTLTTCTPASGSGSHNNPVRSQDPPALVPDVRARRHRASASVPVVSSLPAWSVAAIAEASRLTSGCRTTGSPTPAAPGTGWAAVPVFIVSTSPSLTRYHGEPAGSPSGLNCGQDARACTASDPGTANGWPSTVIVTPRIDGT